MIDLPNSIILTLHIHVYVGLAVRGLNRCWNNCLEAHVAIVTHPIKVPYGNIIALIIMTNNYAYTYIRLQLQMYMLIIIHAQTHTRIQES